MINIHPLPQAGPPRRLRADRLAALLRTSTALATEVHLERLLRVIVEQATEVLDAERSSLFLYDSDRDELWSMVAEGVGATVIRLAASTGLVGYVARTCMPVNLDDAYADARFNPVFDAQTGFRTRSVLCMPILSRSQELLGVIQVLNKKDEDVFSAGDEALLQAFCAHAAVALERATLVEAYAEQQRNQEALKLAHEIQMELLPEPFPVRPDRLDVHAYLASAQLVGGDLYDFFFIDDHRLGFAVGDVSGKGMPAALYMASTHTLLRAFGQEGRAPEQCMRQISAEQRGRASMFVTLFYGILDTRTGLVEYCNAGHHPPCLVRRNGQVSFLPKGGNMPLCSIKSLPFRAAYLVLEPGDLLFLYTDGVVEARAAGNQAFGEQRLQQTLQRHAAEAPAAAIEHVRRELEVFCGDAPPHDDLTMLALRYLD